MSTELKSQHTDNLPEQKILNARKFINCHCCFDEYLMYGTMSCLFAIPLRIRLDKEQSKKNFMTPSLKYFLQMICLDACARDFMLIIRDPINFLDICKPPFHVFLISPPTLRFLIAIHPITWSNSRSNNRCCQGSFHLANVINGFNESLNDAQEHNLRFRNSFVLLICDQIDYFTSYTVKFWK